MRIFPVSFFSETFSCFLENHSTMLFIAYQVDFLYKFMSEAQEIVAQFAYFLMYEIPEKRVF